MKIALVTFAGNDRAGELVGPDAPVPSLAGELAGQGHEVRLYIRGQPERAAPDDDRYETTVLPAGPSAEMPETETIRYLGEYIEQLSRALRASDCEMVHSHGWLGGLATQLAERRVGVPAVQTFHQLQLVDELTEPTVDEPRSRSRTERAVALNADHLIATSDAEQEVLVRAGVPRDHTTVVPAGVRDDRPGEAGGWRASRRLVAFGPAERVAKVIHALRALPRTELVLAGEASEENQRGSVDALTARLGLDDRVSIAPLSADPAELIRAADVVICLSSSAATRNEHLLAMVRGVPLVAGTRTTEAAVIDGVTGVRAVGATPAELAKLLRALLSNEARWLGMSVAGRDHALSRYGWERIGEETERVYQYVLGRVEIPVSRASAHA